MTALRRALAEHRSLIGHVAFAVVAVLAVGLVAHPADRFGYVLGVVIATLAVLTVPVDG